MKLFSRTIIAAFVLSCSICITPFLSKAQDGTPPNPDGNTLPITLTAFSVISTQKGIAKIAWQTSSETNASHFNVQRSFNGSYFTTIAKQQAIGNSSVTSTYSYIDNYENNSNILYYRLQKVDHDGTSNYSNVVKIDINTTMLATLNCYPNPMINNLLTVDVAQIVTAPILYKIVSLNGQLVKQGFILQRQQLINCTDMPKGNYFIKLATGQTLQIIK